MSEEIKWPDEVTMVEADDICRHVYRRGLTRCSLGWCDVALVGNALDPDLRVPLKWRDEYMRQARLLGAVGNTVVTINDDIRNPLGLIARIINRAWAALGYVVNNPECYKNGRLKPIK